MLPLTAVVEITLISQQITALNEVNFNVIYQSAKNMGQPSLSAACYIATSGSQYYSHAPLFYVA